MSRLIPFLLFIFYYQTLYCQETASSCVTCEALKNIELPDVTILSAEDISDEQNHCKVLGVIGKETKFEVLLPNEWNSRFVMSGGGGFSGRIENNFKALTNSGYVTAGTNTGHDGHFLKADWALNNMERQLNFGHQAVHRTAVVSKAIIKAFYCQSPEYNYFMGCSRGGGQALIEAQRYPEDFDGIVALAPIIDWPGTAAEMVQNTQVIYPDKTSLKKALLTSEHIQLLHNKVLKQCDELDGVKDGILNDPVDCSFDFASLPLCTENNSDGTCFTNEQLVAIKTIYKGVSNEEGTIYPGFPIGCEAAPGSWFKWIVGDEKPVSFNFPSLHYAFGTEIFKYLIYNDPDWDYSKYDFTTFNEDTEYAAAYLNASSTDYSEFKKRGGKLIIPHGWNDPALSAFTSIEHYEAVKKEDPEVDDYLRLFIAPGVLHCGGGPGPFQASWIDIIRAWVERDEAPERVVVSKFQDGELVMTRPLFPYPKKAKYKGVGSPDKESSFVVDNQ